ncbi:P-loop containing nucleoside triphosphate hydrolase protein [Gloeopeniophorella convolvens]|nr:P-loop containing nucleoside triphosphate hydrolase protein [Gloeopeniophorella convolvens]
MSKLNATAFEFVPGRGFGPRQPQQSAPPQPPAPAFERHEETEAPAPAPTISLNIGGPKPTPTAPPAAAPAKAPVSAPSAAPVPAAKPSSQAKATPPTSTTPSRTPGSASPAPAAAPSSKTFTLDRAKTDTATIAQEVAAVADREVLEDLFGDIKEHLNIVFIGHVDAGKSTMGGNILFLTGMVDKRTMEKYEREAKEAGRESWYLSWALDSTPQERLKGKTVEVGRAYFETTARRYTILDAPGHKTFVPSMISGAAQADIAILVISARKGEFETGFERGGQTREHIMLVKTAGVNKVIVVINKMDDPTVGWEKARFDEIKDKLTPFVRGAGFNLKTDVTWLPVSAYTGANLKDRVAKSVCSWWDGPSLLEHLDKTPMVDRKMNGPVMMPISEKYKDLGTIAVGKVESGHIRKGDTLLLMPNRDEVEVAAMYNEMEDEVNVAVSGDNVRLRLRGVEDDDISPGFVLTSPGKPVHAVRHFEAQLAILDHKNIICAGYSAVLHVHTLAEEVTLSALLHYFDKSTGRKSRKPPQFAKRGQRVVALIETSAPICIERFVDYPQLGRFTLRDEGKTVAIGKVTKLVEHSIEEAAENLANLSLNAAA